MKIPVLESLFNKDAGLKADMRMRSFPKIYDIGVKEQF